jgi:glucuronoarabinoxylan endo-1,4-beta-xylanase
MFMATFESFTRRALLGVALASAACFGDRPPPPDPQPPVVLPIAVDASQQLQRIDGFGASSAWTAGNMTDGRADELFSPTAGIGLSLLRIRIAPDGTTAETATATKAAARGARVWATPWSPPADWKDATSAQNGGGSLLTDDTPAWADRLAAFAQSMSDQGVPLLFLSAQNEPDYLPTTYESCGYTSSALVAFVKNNLGPALAAKGVAVMAPETANWSHFDAYADAFAGDASAMQFLGPFATHSYGGTPHTVAAVQATGRPVWQTEVSDPNKTLDAGIGSGLAVATMIHDSLVSGQVSAWHYWWINPGSATPPDKPDNSALTANNVLTGNNALTRRAYVLGNWSKFVRPGFVRVSATDAPQPNVLASAFTDPVGGRVVIVAVNLSTADKAQDVTIAGAGAGAGSATPWLTSADVALAAQPPISLTDGAFSTTLPAKSVTTFVVDPPAAAN